MTWSFRKPSTLMALLRWHRAAMRGDKPLKIEDEPQCGWYLTRLVKGGVWVPIEIWCEQVVNENGELVQDEVLRCDAFGEALDPVRIWPFCRPISRQEFLERTDYRMDRINLVHNRTILDLGSSPTPPPRG